MKLYLPLVLILTLLSCDTKEVNREIISHEGEPILVGEIDLLGMSVEPYNVWFDENYRNYTVDVSSLENVNVEDVEILLFLGTWCSDSQLQVPQFIKILNSMKYDLSKLKIIGLDNHPDRDLQSPQGEEKGQDINFVPTFVFLKNDKEVGRIIEYPKVSIEKDMSEILGRK